MKINQTPIRTSRNFKINNIEIKDLEVKDNIKEFNNTEIKNDSSKINIENEIDDFELTYGLDKSLEDQVKNYANQKYKIVINNKLLKNVFIDYKLDKKNSELVDNIEIVAEEGSNANVIIKYECSDNSANCYHNGVIRAFAKANSNLNVIVINLLNEKSNNLMSFENELEENAKLKYTIVDFGGKASISNYYSNIKGDEAINTLNSIYLGRNSQLYDINYITHLRGKKAISEIDVQGALKDKAIKNFKGTIDFKTGCVKAKGSESENCMLISNDAKSMSLPILLCSEEDVEGAHSASSGKVGEKELFYIMSRGFEYKEAMKLLVRANFNKIIESITDEDLKNEILNEIDERLD